MLIERELTVYADEREDRQLFEELPGWFGFFTITLLSQQSQDRVRTRYKCLLSFRSPRFSACGRFHRWSFGWSSFQRVRRTSALRKLDHANDHRRLSRALKRCASVVPRVQLLTLNHASTLSCSRSLPLMTNILPFAHLWRASSRRHFYCVTQQPARSLTFVRSRTMLLLT